ncbi:hypothetical protein NM680_10630 [Paracoccus sp. PS-1]|uniref:hypothetical protein n=1 Tax=Paracoccus sp. PS1 TaxID=2963938 RepID=UPI0027E5AD6F|nr:hypothetical protein [Paracoccus sp. PS1]MDQ7262248.1 hypothetical protein [Paracoccus sp. PS1]
MDGRSLISPNGDATLGHRHYLVQFFLVSHCFPSPIGAYRKHEGDGWSAPNVEGEKGVRLQIVALILQVLVAVALIANIIHHW